MQTATLAAFGRNSIVQVADPEANVWYWVVIDNRLKDDQHWFKGQIDPAAIASGASLRSYGTVFFHENNVLYIWPGLYKIASGIAAFWAALAVAERRLSKHNAVCWVMWQASDHHSLNEQDGRSQINAASI